MEVLEDPLGLMPNMDGDQWCSGSCTVCGSKCSYSAGHNPPCRCFSH